MQRTPTSRPLLCRELVGRQQELEQLQVALRQVASGNPQFMLISGEAGLGKTRLCRAFVQSNQVQSALRFWGRALPQDQAIPFAPFSYAFRHSLDTIITSLKQGDHASLSSMAFAVHLLPELASHVPDIITSSPDQTRSPSKRQQMLFHDAFQFFQALAQIHKQPIVFVLEDLHWADETSLELLSFLAYQLDSSSMQADPPVPLLLLGTYRSEGLADNAALQRMMRHLQAQRYMTELHLTPLTAGEHRLCVNFILGQPAPEHFADFLFSWDEGNPLYAEELLGSMATTGELHKEPQSQAWFIPPGSRPHLPSSITAAILEQFAQLPDLDQEVLTYASVIGRAFDFPLLAAVCGVEEQAIVKVLSRALSRQLLSEVTRPRGAKPGQLMPSRYRFRHALIREALYDRLHGAERHLYHRAVAEAIERLLAAPSTPVSTRSLSVDQIAALLAKHYQLAGLLEQARPYALQAAQRASELCAFREERYYLELAQASLPEDNPERLALFERLGLVSVGTYDLEEALRWLELAQTGYERIGQPLQALRVMVNMLLPQWFLARQTLPALIAQIETEVEQSLAQERQTSQNAQVLAIAGNLALYWGSHGYLRRASHWIEISQQLYTGVNDPGKEDAFQKSIISRGFVKVNRQPALAEEGIKEVRSAIQYAHQHSLLDVLQNGYVHLGIILLFRGDLDGAERVFEETMLYEQRSGMLHPAFVRGWYHFFSGQWEEGIQVLRKSVERLEQSTILMLAVVEGMVLSHILLARNHLLEAEMLLQRTQTFFEPLQQQSFLLWAEWGFAKLSAAQGNQPQARYWYERLLKHWHMTQDTLIIPPMLLDGIRFFVQTHHLKQAGEWFETLRGVVAVSGTPVGKAALSEAEGVMAAAEGPMQDAIQALRQAVEGWKALKWRYRQAEVSLQLAEVLLEWTRRSAISRPERQQARDEAEKLLESTEQLYESLGLPARVEQVQAMRALTGIAAQRKRRATLAERHSAQGLTPKETQVLSLLVAGKTNKEIAAHLSITVGTVELHVTHILTKLRCETRTQAVTKAISKGLVTMPYTPGHP